MDQKILDKFGVTEEWIEENAKQYEDGTYELSDPSSPIYYGGPKILHEDEQYVAIPYADDELTQVNMLAKEQGVEPVAIFKLAMKQYLQKEAVNC